VLGYKLVEIGMGKLKKYVTAGRSVSTLDGSTMLMGVSRNTNQIPA
jgi:hypothetical protein